MAGKNPCVVFSITDILVCQYKIVYNFAHGVFDVRRMCTIRRAGRFRVRRGGMSSVWAVRGEGAAAPAFGARTNSGVMRLVLSCRKKRGDYAVRLVVEAGVPVSM